ncbi:hypothetical protein FD723_39990 (plasmid) [Nostoc sp. C052]|uniref:hypothetical protein n=1 Tax=Nostoc sp. C052 TaxID=2576902 RepID=UPI0015C3B135|nr:hypothetical protein [Nostoc sp. C052]QLE46395.1 hypothetical protein FD723_39990 [Nostoc sp. C052]
MANPLEKKINDIAIKPEAPDSPAKPRVPLAQEFALGFQIVAYLFQLSRPQGWQVPPICKIVENKLKIQGQALLRTYPTESLPIDTTIAIPPLESTTTVVKRDDFLSLVGFIAEVGITQDPSIGVSFRYREPNTNNIITSPLLENSRRYRAFWMLVLSNTQITAEEFLNYTSLEANGDRRLAIVNKQDQGYLLSPNLRVWALDANLKDGVAYTLLPDAIEILPICIIKRVQNYQEDGYIQGYGGEGEIAQDLISSVANGQLLHELNNEVIRRLIHEICRGVPGKGKVIKRVIINLSAGQASGNPGKAGIAANSLNGSYCIGNDQRIGFTNQKVTQKLGVTVVIASNDGSGRARLATGLNTNAPLGSIFSADKADHRIYSIDGIEQSALGNFSNLGGSGSLQWVAGENSTIRPGSQAFFVPAIIYPAGSGFSVPFLRCEHGYFSNGATISPINIRPGISDDIAAFELPQDGEPFIVITDSARAAILYIYKLVSVTADANGVVTIPLKEKGCFAFIQNYPGRIDAPVCKGLVPNQTYSALVYYPPRSQETWQFQFAYTEYQGVGVAEPNFLEGATILTPPLQVLHTQGGGLSVHVVNSSLRESLVGMHLPSLPSSPIKSYDFDAPIQLPSESYDGPITLRHDIPPLPAPNLAFPTPGQVISLKTTSTLQDRSLKSALYVNEQLLGVRSPILASRSPYQLVIAFAAKKAEQLRLVVITHNCYGVAGENIAFDPSQDTAIDIFEF